MEKTCLAWEEIFKTDDFKVSTYLIRLDLCILGTIEGEYYIYEKKILKIRFKIGNSRVLVLEEFNHLFFSSEESGDVFIFSIDEDVQFQIIKSFRLDKPISHMIPLSDFLALSTSDCRIYSLSYDLNLNKIYEPITFQSDLVQLSAYNEILIVSAFIKSFLIVSGVAIPIGKKDRNAPFGACMIDEDIVYASSPSGDL